jgi:hypothetical protein
MNSEDIRKLETKLFELSREELFELIKSTLANNAKVKKEGGLSQRELAKEICVSFFKNGGYNPTSGNRLNGNIELLLQRVRRIVTSHPDCFESFLGTMFRDDGVPVKTTLWKLRQPEPELKQEPQREEQPEEKAREEEEQTFKFPFRLREEYPTLAELLEELPATLSEKAAQSIKLNVDEIILFSAMQHGFFHDEAEEAFVKNYAHSLIDSKVSASQSERKTDNDSRIRQYTNKFVSLLKR